MMQTTPIEYKAGDVVFQYTKEGDIRCPQCSEPLRSMGAMLTLAVYESPPGHDHDDSGGERGYKCQNNHFFGIFVQKHCTTPFCKWVGKEKAGSENTLIATEWPEDSWVRQIKPTPGVPQLIDLEEDEKKALIEHCRKTAVEAGYWDPVLERDLCKRRELWESQLSAGTRVRSLGGELLQLQVALACEQGSGTCVHVHDRGDRDICTPANCMSMKEAIENAKPGEDAIQMHKRVYEFHVNLEKLVKGQG